MILRESWLSSSPPSLPPLGTPADNPRPPPPALDQELLQNKIVPFMTCTEGPSLHVWFSTQRVRGKKRVRMRCHSPWGSSSSPLCVNDHFSDRPDRRLGLDLACCSSGFGFHGGKSFSLKCFFFFLLSFRNGAVKNQPGNYARR